MQLTSISEDLEADHYLPPVDVGGSMQLCPTQLGDMNHLIYGCATVSSQGSPKSVCISAGADSYHHIALVLVAS